MPASSLLRDNGLRIGLVIGVSGPGGCWPRLARGPTSSPNPVGAGLLSFLSFTATVASMATGVVRMLRRRGHD